jgi:ankyrin repeat protein
MALSQNSTHLFLFTACEKGDLQTIKTHSKSLSSSEICSIRDENQATLLHYASRYGYLEILQYFIEIKRIDISQLRTEHGATCAHDAAVCDQMEYLNTYFIIPKNFVGMLEMNLEILHYISVKKTFFSC